MSSATDTGFDIVSLVLPETLDDERSLDVVRFLDASELLNQLLRTKWGNEDHCKTAADRLITFQPTLYRDQIRLLGLKAGEVVAVGEAVMPLSDNQTLAYIRVDVDPAARSVGLATAMLAQLESIAERAGRTIFLGGTEIPDTGAEGNVIRPATGVGAVPAGSAETRFALKSGYQLDLVERMSVIELPIGDGQLNGYLERARPLAEPHYESIGWTDLCPEDLLNDYALLKTEISADQPLGDLDMTAEHWDAGRVRAAEKQLISKGGHSITTAIRHKSTGKLVGHSVIEYFGQTPEAGWQDDTLVLSDHRGHRLGLLMKVLNLKGLTQAYPDAKRVYTWNASENAHMLSINDALGFRAHGITGIWQKKIG